MLRISGTQWATILSSAETSTIETLRAVLLADLSVVFGTSLPTLQGFWPGSLVISFVQGVYPGQQQQLLNALENSDWLTATSAFYENSGGTDLPLLVLGIEENGGTPIPIPIPSILPNNVPNGTFTPREDTIEASCGVNCALIIIYMMVLAFSLLGIAVGCCIRIMRQNKAHKAGVASSSSA